MSEPTGNHHGELSLLLPPDEMTEEWQTYIGASSPLEAYMCDCEVFCECDD